MTCLASRFDAANLIRRDRPLTREELFRVVPSVFSEEKHASRSARYTWIPTITVLENLQREGFQPFFACQTRVRDPGRREHTKHMLRLRREGQITGKQVPEIILLNSHDGTSSCQMLPGLFRAVCANGLVCGESFGEVRVPSGIKTSLLKTTTVATSAWWFVTLKVEWSGGRGALNRMPVKGLTVISASQASSEHPPPDHTDSSSLYVLYFPYASHRCWRFY